jgi:hypothetical protein
MESVPNCTDATFSPAYVAHERTPPSQPPIHVLTDGVGGVSCEVQWQTSLQTKFYLFKEVFARRAQLPTDGALCAFFSFTVTQTR